MVLVVIVIFAICWLPIHTILVLRSFDLYPNTPTSLALQVGDLIKTFPTSSFVAAVVVQ